MMMKATVLKPSALPTQRATLAPVSRRVVRRAAQDPAAPQGGCGGGGGGCGSCGGSEKTSSSLTGADGIAGTSAGALAGMMAGEGNSVSRNDITEAFALQPGSELESEKVHSIADLLASCPDDGVWVDDGRDHWTTA